MLASCISPGVMVPSFPSSPSKATMKFLKALTSLQGALVLFVPEADADAALAAMRSVPAGQDAVVVGRAEPRATVPVVMDTGFGGTRIVDMLVGEQLPRIC